MKGLTERQREVLDYIQNYIETYKYSPSYREIMAHFGFSSIGSVSKHVKVLQRKGVLINENNGGRSLLPKKFAIEKPLSQETKVPFIGHLTAGIPIETFPYSQSLTIPDYLVPNPEKTYVLRVRGDSLVSEMIVDGDLLIVEARDEALAGEKILGVVENNKTVIKQYFPEGNSVRLTSLSKEEITIRNVELTIQGVINGVLRLYI